LETRVGNPGFQLVSN